MKFIKINQCEAVPIERELSCGFCGKFVRVTERKDRRFKYCSQKCEKQYWRERSKHKCTSLQTLSIGGLQRKLAFDAWENRQF